MNGRVPDRNSMLTSHSSNQITAYLTTMLPDKSLWDVSDNFRFLNGEPCDRRRSRQGEAGSVVTG